MDDLRDRGAARLRWVGAAALVAVASAAALETSEDSLPAASGMFMLGGIASAAVLRRPAAWFLVLAAGAITGAIDLDPTPSPFPDDFVIMAWVVTSMPGALVAGLLGYALDRRGAPN